MSIRLRKRNGRHINSAYQFKNYSIFNFRRHLVTERNREELDEVSNRRLTSMALDVSRGLSYLAELKYVHRDVACRNCLVNSSRVVKLADFGMTRPMYENDYYRFSRKGMAYKNMYIEMLHALKEMYIAIRKGLSIF